MFFGSVKEESLARGENMRIIWRRFSERRAAYVSPYFQETCETSLFQTERQHA